MKPHDEIIWRVDIDPEYLTFTQEDRPKDFMEISEKQEYSELNGTYCGHRGFDDTIFRLIRRLKADNFYDSGHKDIWGNFSLREWRISHGFAYAWEPSYFYKHNGRLYATHINFR